VVPLCVFYLRVALGDKMDLMMRQFGLMPSAAAADGGGGTEHGFTKFHIVLYVSLSLVFLVILNMIWFAIIRKIIHFCYSRRELKSKNRAQQLIIQQRKVLNEMMARYRYEYVNDLVHRYGKSLRFYEQHFNGSKNAETQTSPDEEKTFIFDWIKERHMVLKSRVETHSVSVDTSGIGSRRTRKEAGDAQVAGELVLDESNVYTEKEEQMMSYIHTQNQKIASMRKYIHDLREHIRDAGMTAKMLPPQKLFPFSGGSSTHQKHSSGDSNEGDQTSEPTGSHQSKASSLSNALTTTMGKKKTSWFDRVLNKVIGNDAEHCVALICEECHTHNGLQLLEDARGPAIFKCYECGHLNHTRTNAAPLRDTMRDIEILANENASSNTLPDHAELLHIENEPHLELEEEEHTTASSSGETQTTKT